MLGTVLLAIFYHSLLTLLKGADRLDFHVPTIGIVRTNSRSTQKLSLMLNLVKGMGPFPAPRRLGFRGNLFCPSLPTRGALFGRSGFGSSATTARSRSDRGHGGEPSQSH